MREVDSIDRKWSGVLSFSSQFSTQPTTSSMYASPLHMCLGYNSTNSIGLYDLKIQGVDGTPCLLLKTDQLEETMNILIRLGSYGMGILSLACQNPV